MSSYASDELITTEYIKTNKVFVIFKRIIKLPEIKMYWIKSYVFCEFGLSKKMTCEKLTIINKFFIFIKKVLKI